jgi:histidinol-phosphatase (PHP family)
LLTPKAYRDMGGRFTLSDDAHGVAQVGLNYQSTKTYLEQLGVEELYLLEEAEQKGSPLQLTRVSLNSIIVDHYPSSVPP